MLEKGCGSALSAFFYQANFLAPSNSIPPQLPISASYTQEQHKHSPALCMAVVNMFLLMLPGVSVIWAILIFLFVGPCPEVLRADY